MSKTKSPMDTKASSSSGSSSASSFVDLKSTDKRNTESMQAMTSTRSRSFLHCLGKHLGRHFPHHQHQDHNEQQQQQQQQQQKRHTEHRERCQNMLTIYNSEEDIHSSSTDSFSLSYERCSAHTPTHITGFGIDLAGEERSSGTSSASSGYSHYSSVVFTTEPDDFWTKQTNGRRHFFDETMYRRPVSALGQFSTDEYSNNSQDDNENEDQNEHDPKVNVTRNTRNNNKNTTLRKHKQNQQEQMIQKTKQQIDSQSNMSSDSKFNGIETPQSRSRSISPCSITKGLNLNRISITSSVCRMFQNLTTSSSNTTNTTRSLSCSSTPLRSTTKRYQQDNTNATTMLKTTNSKKATSMSSRACNGNAKKKDKKQQSILRPPVHYVYMKGMSGLYSRVPRYTVCYPYTTTHQAA